jgi:hypothetical protein
MLWPWQLQGYSTPSPVVEGSYWLHSSHTNEDKLSGGQFLDWMYPNDTFLSLQHFHSLLTAEVIFQRGLSGEWNREYMAHHMTWDPFLWWLHEESTLPHFSSRAW